MSQNHPEPMPPEQSQAAAPDAPCASLDRRAFLSRLSLMLGAFGAMLLGVPVIGSVLAPLFERPSGVWRPVGRLGDFTIGQTVEVTFEDPSPLPWAGVTARTGAWLRRDGTADFTAFSINCAHLGCPVRWLADAELFMCPCHGGAYYKDGSVAAGPPPRGLSQYPVRVRNGQVEIHTRPVPIT